MKFTSEIKVSVVTHWGSDQGIVESARMSTQRPFRGWGTKGNPGDEKLLYSLAKDGHTSPFEQAGATFEVHAPIFVARQWMRHRTQSYNELSARYVEMPALAYIPEVFQDRNASTRGPAAERVEEQDYINRIYKMQVEEAYDLYKYLRDLNVAKEQARMLLPVCMMTRFHASANLLNWLKFLRLRLAKDAQNEIRMAAEQISEALEERFPHTIAAWRTA